MGSQISGIVLKIIKVLATCEPQDDQGNLNKANSPSAEEIEVLKDLLKFNITGSIQKDYVDIISNLDL